MNTKNMVWDSIKWSAIEKIVYEYHDRSIAPRYHRSYTITITNKERVINIHDYYSTLLSRTYPNNQEGFEKFKETLAGIGIFSHEKIENGLCGVPTLYLNLYNERECVFSRYTHGVEDGSGNMFLPKGAIGLFHNELSESVGFLIQETLKDVYKQDEEERKRRKEEEKIEKKRKEEEKKEKKRKEEEEKQNMTSEKRAIFDALSRDMIFIEGGSFLMGSDNGEANENEKPIHKVQLSSYYLCRYEVTQELWFAVMGSNPSKFKDNRKPVEQVSLEECQEFIRKLNFLTDKSYRLPTEAEWEYAARGGKKSRGYIYAGGDNIDVVAWWTQNTNDKETHPVGQKLPNELGLYDMSGNVWEWCQDKYECYSSSEQIDPHGPDHGSYYVYRGGGYNSNARNCRITRRNFFFSSFRYSHLGLRLAL